MSGIAGLLNLSGAPIDRTLLARLTNSLRFRGPDAQRMWCRGQIGFGHTLLRSTIESKDEQQPLSLDGNSWIVSDARIDGRRELIAKLQSRCQQPLQNVPDPELILRAYQAWGESCVDHLLGDFAFAIWNSRSRRLFCARDHFGVKPFFYARTGDSLIFSNTLDCLRRHPGISDRLNDLAIADFLLFDNNQDLSTTAFTDILRLAPAHALECEAGRVTTRRYWNLPETVPLERLRPEECLAQFRSVLDAAVADRLRTPSAAILMSGGLDSPTIAASVRRVADRRGTPCDFRAYTHIHERLIPHEEKHYAGLVASSLRLPIFFMDGDNCQIFDAFDDPDFRSPEPTHFPMGCRLNNPFPEIAQWTRTMFTGYGGDPGLASLISAHFRRLFQSRRFGRIASDAASYFLADGRLSRLYIGSRWRRWRVPKPDMEPPAWFHPELFRRLGMRDRSQRMNTNLPNGSARPEGYQSVASRMWTPLFEGHDAAVVGSPIEFCHPFFDLRVLQFLLSLPTLPWCSDKQLFRESARGVLPDSVRLRKKSPLMADPIVALLQKPESAWVDSFQVVPELNEYVIRDRVQPVFQIESPLDAWVHLKPLSLNFWLQRRFNLGDQLASVSNQEPVSVSAS